jgi:hypothetical protein
LEPTLAGRLRLTLFEALFPSADYFFCHVLGERGKIRRRNFNRDPAGRLLSEGAIRALQQMLGIRNRDPGNPAQNRGGHADGKTWACGFKLQDVLFLGYSLVHLLAKPLECLQVFIGKLIALPLFGILFDDASPAVCAKYESLFVAQTGSPKVILLNV